MTRRRTTSTCASASRLHHRNILGVLYSQANKLPHFIVTPAVGDITLASRLASSDASDRPSFGDTVRCAIQLADALAYAHRQRCVHGRLRPSEVRFDSEGQPMLSGSGPSSTAGRLTRRRGEAWARGVHLREP